MELPEEDRPPEAIWLNPSALNDHFDSVNARYKAKSSNMEVIEDAPMMQSEFSKKLRKKR